MCAGPSSGVLRVARSATRCRPTNPAGRALSPGRSHRRRRHSAAQSERRGDDALRRIRTTRCWRWGRCGLGRRRPWVEHGGVDGPVQQPIDLIGEADLANDQLDVGVGDGERADQRLGEPHSADETEHQLVCVRARAPSSSADGRVAGDDGRARVLEERISGRRGSDPAGVSFGGHRGHGVTRSCGSHRGAQGPQLPLHRLRVKPAGSVPDSPAGLGEDRSKSSDGRDARRRLRPRPRRSPPPA